MFIPDGAINLDCLAAQGGDLMKRCVTGVEVPRCHDLPIRVAEDVIGRIGNPTNVAGFLRASQIPKLRRRITEKTPKPRKACFGDTVRIQSEQDVPKVRRKGA
jgi:hypothetical protein